MQSSAMDSILAMREMPAPNLSPRWQGSYRGVSIALSQYFRPRLFCFFCLRNTQGEGNEVLPATAKHSCKKLRVTTILILCPFPTFFLFLPICPGLGNSIKYVVNSCNHSHWEHTTCPESTTFIILLANGTQLLLGNVWVFELHCP